MFIRALQSEAESMHAARVDRSLQSTLEWAMNRMKEKGYVISSQVTLSVDPKLSIMGYARKEGDIHRIIISEWALDSEMLGGLVLHELAHVYFTEHGAHSHDGQILDEVLEGLKEREGLRNKETEYLIDAFNHLQNILVDDIVFAVMDEKEQTLAKRFFSEWVSDRPSGDPVLDAALLCRNAFAIASLKRRDLFDGDNDMKYRNQGFLTAFGRTDKDFDWIESFLETSKSEWGKEQFSQAVEVYFETILSIMRSAARLDDLR